MRRNGRSHAAAARPRADPRRALTGQKALVTGASSGIGRAIALALGRSGADVVVNFRSRPAEAEAVAREIRALGVKAVTARADVGIEDEVIAMFERAVAELGTIDILVNNAGIQKDAPIEAMTLDDWDAVLRVNLTSMFLCAREAVREFKRRGVRRSVSRAAGKIICVSSVHDVIPWAGRVNYTASKGGVAMFMKSLAQEVAPDRIRVNSIAPGAIRTAINRASWESEAARKKLLELIPYNRVGDPDDVGRVAAWLASDEADYITGETIYVDGGMTLYPAFQRGG